MAFSAGGLTSDNITFWNNIHHFSRREITTGTSGGVPTNFSIDYNLNYDEDGGLYAKLTGTEYYSMADLTAALGYESNGVYGQALFVDASNGDFHLLPTSPGIDAGAVILGFNDPFSAWPLSGSAADMGAFEYVSGPDTSPPFRFGGEPSGVLRAGTASATLAVSTNRVADCRYSATASTTYAQMTNAFANVSSTVHTTTVTGLTHGTPYSYYVRCKGDNAAVNQDDYEISFSVAADDSSPPLISGIAAFPDETFATIVWNTDDGSTSLVRYATSTSSLDLTEESTLLVTSHSIQLTGQKWFRKSEQGDKWNRCLIEGMIVLSETGARDEQTPPP